MSEEALQIAVKRSERQRRKGKIYLNIYILNIHIYIYIYTYTLHIFECSVTKNSKEREERIPQ